MIRLTVPGTLRYRALVLRVIASSCRLVRFEEGKLQEASHVLTLEADFDAQLVSAVGEAFNNIAIHGYRNREPGSVEVEVLPLKDRIEVCIADYGEAFDPTMTLPLQLSNDPDHLLESGMGLFIINSFSDGVSYRPGSPPDSPNVLCLTKLWRSKSEAPTSGALSPERDDFALPAANQQQTKVGK